MINNTNLETGHRLQEPSPKQNNDLLQRLAKAVAQDKDEYAAVLNAMGIEVSDNSPKADGRDFVYAFADHPTWKIRGERLGLDYGRYSVERGFSVHGLDRASERRTVLIARSAVDVGDTGELRQSSSFVAICERYAARSVTDLEETMQCAGSDEDRKAISNAIEYARSHEVIPAETPHAKPRKAQSAPKPWEKHPWQERGSHTGESQRQQIAQQQAQRQRKERNEHDR